ncbi:protein scarlet isoform X1 [Nilaparvata lugens]|uniref:protein scarlet isoform X1 n=2 Tax=Nilaparvata lugens TaxID=108931 RepID=UPI00193E588F|nr:protein scarlet isoform X1 [Nilaparvata lugens]XP_039289946.1 protein scarlet isoform X1 [Nilaparvata lugens]
MTDEALFLSWHNLSLWAPDSPSQNGESWKPWKTKKPTKLLLDNLSGFAKSGSLLAIMGPSGSGKTTLLATISKRITDQLQGEILLNGKPLDKDLMMRISGFVPQQDLAVDTLTVKEHIQFMANLKMDNRLLKTQREVIVDTLIKDLSLKNCSETLLGEISGGERKRASLAVQMLTDPPLLFCDEPTTGLDSYSAATVVKMLSQLARRGKAVVCTIHQPASDVYILFDRLCLLLPGGHMAYHGDSSAVRAHFQSMGVEFLGSYNPADILLQRLNPRNRDDKIAVMTAFDNSLAKAELTKELAVISNSAGPQSFYFGIEDKFLKYYTIQRPALLLQMRLLLWRTSISMFRNSQRILLRLMMYIFTGLLVSTPYTQLALDQKGIQNFQGFHYAVITETIFCHAYSVMHTFPSEIPVLLREMANGLYKPGPYYFSKVLILVPRAIIETLLFCSVVFYVAQVKGGALGFLMFTAPVIASAVTSTAYGCFISAMFENIATASLLFVPLDFISYTFCGLFLQLSTVPFYLKWVKYISRFYYGIEAISILQWQHVDDIACSNNPDIPCIRTGEGVLEKYGFNSMNLSLDFFAMFIAFCLLHVFGFLNLKRRSKQQSIY